MVFPSSNVLMLHACFEVGRPDLLKYTNQVHLYILMLCAPFECWHPDLLRSTVCLYYRYDAHSLRRRLLVISLICYEAHFNL